MSAATMVAAATAIFHFKQKDTHDDYLKAVDPNTIEQKYDTYNLFFKLRNNAALAYGGIWLYSFFDALLAEPKERPLRVAIFMGEFAFIQTQFSF